MMGLPAFRARGFDIAHAAAGTIAALPSRHPKRSPRVGLADKGDVRAKDLSYGDRRALEIAVALAQGPRVLCLDEPTSGLGSDGVQRLAALVARLKGRLTIVAIEHDMEFLFSLADRISVIHWGQVVARGTPHELQQNEWVQALQPREVRMILEVDGGRYLLRRDAGAVRRLARRRARQGVCAARAQRRRQDHHAALDPRADAPAPRRGPLRRARRRRAIRPTRSRARASAGCPTTGGCARP